MKYKNQGNENMVSSISTLVFHNKQKPTIRVNNNFLNITKILP